MKSAAGKAAAHDAAHARAQSETADQLRPTALMVAMAATIEVMKKVRNNGTTKWV